MKRTLLILFGGMVIGLGAGWAMWHGTAWEGGDEESEVAPGASERSRPVASDRAGSRTESHRAWVDKAIRYGDDYTRDLMDKLETRELPELLAALAEHAGVFGLSSSERNLFLDLFREWVARDREAALLWIDGREHPQDRERLYSQLIGHVTQIEDFESALAFYRKLKRSGREGVGWPNGLLTESISRGADAFIEVCAATRAKESEGLVYYRFDFSEGFDFRRALSGLAELERELSEDERIPIRANMVSEWAKRDPQAAFDWVSQGNEMPGSSGIGEFMEGYSQVASDAEYGGLMAEIQQRDERTGNPHKEVWKSLRRKPTKPVVDAYLDSLGPGVDRTANLGPLLDRAHDFRMTSPREVRQALYSAMTPAERMNYLTSPENRGSLVRYRDELEPLFRRLGHSETEIRRLFPEAESRGSSD